MSSDDSIELRHDVDTTDTRVLRARVHKGGLRIEGHDMGKGVEDFWGEGLTEYEWVVDVAAGDVPRLAEALAGSRTSHIIDVIRRTCLDDPDRLERTLVEHDIPRKVWNRVGE